MKHLWIFALLLAAVSCRSDGKMPQQLASANRLALEASVDPENGRVESDGKIEFTPAILDLGEVRLGETRTAEVVVRNLSDKPLVILDAYTSCRCTQAKWDKRPLAPQASARIDVRFTGEEAGTFFKKIMVRHSASPRPVSFAVQGIVTEKKE